jgi:hypothetical protein
MLLDLFLASLMRDSADLGERLRAANISRERLHEVKRQAKALGFLRGRSVPTGEFVAFFGPPKDADDESLRYELELWPDHYYQLGMNQFGGVFHYGFVLKVADTTLPVSLPVDPEVAKASFRVGFHTFAEVEQALGPPLETQGWDAMEDWFYGPVPGDQYLAFEFDFGLLSAITHRAFPVVLRAGNRNPSL